MGEVLGGGPVWDYDVQIAASSSQTKTKTHIWKHSIPFPFLTAIWFTFTARTPTTPTNNQPLHRHYQFCRFLGHIIYVYIRKKRKMLGVHILTSICPWKRVRNLKGTLRSGVSHVGIGGPLSCRVQAPTCLKNPCRKFIVRPWLAGSGVFNWCWC